MTLLGFFLLVLAIACGVVLGHVVLRQANSAQAVLVGLILVLVLLLLLQIGPGKVRLGQVDHASDKCLLYDGRMTQCGPAAPGGGDLFPNLPGEPT